MLHFKTNRIFYLNFTKDLPTYIFWRATIQRANSHFANSAATFLEFSGRQRYFGLFSEARVAFMTTNYRRVDCQHCVDKAELQPRGSLLYVKLSANRVISPITGRQSLFYYRQAAKTIR